MLTVGYLVEGKIDRALAANDPSKTGRKADSDDPSKTARKADSVEIPDTPKVLLNETESVPDASESKDEKEDLQDFQATAYSIKGLTASGEPTRPGIIAADPRVLPLGTVVHLKAGRYTGTYTVKDTGGRIKGRKVDIYIPNYKEAKKFGRQRVKIKIIKSKPIKSKKPAL
jgi:3D (Asp-Asp-Asp) domain-containing protein